MEKTSTSVFLSNSPKGWNLKELQKGSNWIVYIGSRKTMEIANIQQMFEQAAEIVRSNDAKAHQGKHLE